MPYKVGLPPEQSFPKTTGVSPISNIPVIPVMSGDQGLKVQENLNSIRAWVVEEARGENGDLRAVLICSTLLEAHLWMILDRSFQPKDNLAVYYAEEIPLLKGKSLEDLKLIQETKLIFPGAKVIQEGPDSPPAEEPQ